MPEPAKQVRPWPRPMTVFLLFVYVVVDAALWLYGFYELMLVGTVEEGERHGIEVHLEAAGTYLTLAIVVMLLGGWAWRWAVAAGHIGGRPTARFGGA